MKMKKSMFSKDSSAIPSHDEEDDELEESKRPDQLFEISEVGEEGVTDAANYTTSAQLKDTSKFNKRPAALFPEKAQAMGTSSRRPAGLTVDTTKGKIVGAQNKNIADFSPMTPSKTIGVRFNA
jgi:hypothetical protein